MNSQKAEPVPCQETDPEIFFTDITGHSSLYTINTAKRICNTCWFKQGCLELALSLGDVYGIWGGMTRRERWKIAAVRGINLSKYYAISKTEKPKIVDEVSDED